MAKSAKPGYFEKLRTGTAHREYDPAVEGFGTPRQWRGEFYQRMGVDEAERIKNEAGSTWRPECKIIGDLAGVCLTDDSMWDEIKSAFLKAAMNCHPDRTAQHGKDKVVAEEEFKQANAAYAILAHRYGKD